MAWLPISWTVPQYVDSNGDPYSGAVLKMYQDGTTTNTNMATDNTGGTALSSVALDSNGYPSNGGSVFIPHIDQAYKIALYANQTAADADTGAIWTIDNLTPADLTGTNTDEKSKVSSNDTTAGYLNGKLVGGTNVDLTEGSDGGNETLTLSVPDSPTFAGNVTFSKGADVASASALSPGADGNYFDVTGTTGITSIDAIGVGTVIKLHFDAVLTLTYHATNLILPGGANITTAAGDEAEFVEYATGDWRCTNYYRNAEQKNRVIQVVHTQDGTVATGTTTLPLDDTTPQNTEGDEYITLAITPTSATNKLKIEAVLNLSHSAGSGAYMSTALFQDSTADALAAAWGAREPSAAGQSQVVLIHYMTAGTTSSTTFKIRAGTGTAGTTTFNGALGNPYYNGLYASTLTITEISA